MRKILLGIFPKEKDADSVLIRFEEIGFDPDEISVVAKAEVLARFKEDTVSKGVIAGGILGGLAGLLLTVTPVVIPGHGVILSGPLTALTGFALGAITGGFLGALVDLGVPLDSATIYQNQIEKGGVLLAVTVTELTEQEAREVLKSHHAQEITVIPYNKRIKREPLLRGIYTPAFHLVSKPSKRKKSS